MGLNKRVSLPALQVKSFRGSLCINWYRNPGLGPAAATICEGTIGESIIKEKTY